MVCNVVPEIAVTLPNVGAVIVPHEFALQTTAPDQDLMLQVYEPDLE